MDKKIAIASLALFALAVVIAVSMLVGTGPECIDCGCNAWMKQDFHCDMAAFNKSEAARCFREYFNTSEINVEEIYVFYKQPFTDRISHDPGWGYDELLALGGTHGFDAKGDLYFTGYCG